MFRNRKEYRFEGRIHEQISRRMPTYLPERFESAGVGILHHGYLSPRVAAREKSQRNLSLLELEAGEAPSPYVSFNLGSEYQRLGDWSTAALHFGRAWSAVRSQERWPSIGYAPVLALRTARARRECGAVEEARGLLSDALEQLPRYTDLVFELGLAPSPPARRPRRAACSPAASSSAYVPSGLASTVGAGSQLARQMLERLEPQPMRPRAV